MSNKEIVKGLLERLPEEASLSEIAFGYVRGKGFLAQARREQAAKKLKLPSGMIV